MPVKINVFESSGVKETDCSLLSITEHTNCVDKDILEQSAASEDLTKLSWGMCGNGPS